MLTVYKNVGKVDTPDKVPDNLTENQQLIIALIEGNNRISMQNMAIEVGISKRKILDNINKLREKEFLARVGSTKTGHWVVLKTEK